MPYYKQYTVTILGFDGALASAICGALDIFSLAGVSWEHFNGEKSQPRFNVQVASIYKNDVICSNQLTLCANIDINEVQESDIVLVPTIGGNIHKILAETQNLIPHLNRLHSQKSDIVSNCSGAFLLANAGLLDGRLATTHWGYAKLFSSMFPKVNLNANQMITQDDNIFCAGGGLSFQDMCLKLIERYCGREVANHVAKAHVINRQSGYQTTYANLHSYKGHNQSSLIKVQEHIEAHYESELRVEMLAKLVNLSERTLNRQFQKHVGMKPTEYIQSVRIENAKRLLEQGLHSTKQLANKVGYEDHASFSRLFKRKTGYTPNEYRTNFSREYAIL